MLDEMRLGNVRSSARQVMAAVPTNLTPGMFGANIGQSLRDLGGAMRNYELSREAIADSDQRFERAIQADENRVVRATTRSALVNARRNLGQQLELFRRERGDETGVGLVSDTNQIIDAYVNEVQSTIPEALQPEFAAEIAQMRSSYLTAAFNEQLALGDAAFSNALESVVTDAVEGIQLGTMAPDEARARLDAIIADSPMDAATTGELYESANLLISTEEYRQELTAGMAEPGGLQGELPGAVGSTDVSTSGLAGTERGLLNAIGLPPTDYVARQNPQAAINVGEHTGRPDQSLLNILSNSVVEAFGAGAAINISSGHEGRSSGTRRHPAGTAADLSITRPDGSTVRTTDPDFRAFTHIAARAGIHGIGYATDGSYMGHTHVHMDIFPPSEYAGEGHLWAGAERDTELMRIMQERAAQYGDTPRGGGEAGPSPDAYYTTDDGQVVADLRTHPGGAAGRYSISDTAWRRASAALGLEDFSPSNQDRAALWLAQQVFETETGNSLQTELASNDPVRIEAVRQVLLAGSEDVSFDYLRDMSAGEFAGLVQGSQGTLPAQIFDERFSSVPLETRQSIFSDIMTQRQRQQEAQFSAYQESRSSFMTELTAGLEMGLMGQEDLRRGNEQYGFSLSEQQDLLTALETGQSRAMNAQNVASQLQSGNITLNPGDSADRNAMDGYSQAAHQEILNNQDAAGFESRVIEDVASLNYVPETVVESLRRGFNSQDPEAREFARNAMSAVFAAAPHAAGLAFNETEERMAAFNAVASQYLDRETLEATIGRMTDPAQQNALSQDRQRLQQVMSQNPDWFTADTIAREIDDRWRDRAIQPGTIDQGFAMQTEMIELFRHFHMAGATPQMAREAATSLMRTRYGVSSLGGTEVVMRRPPENYAAPDASGSFDWMDQVVRQDLGLSDDAEYRVVPTGATERDIQQGRIPRYEVYVADENGLFLPAVAPSANIEDYFDGGPINAPAQIVFDQPPEVREERVQETVRLNVAERRMTDLTSLAAGITTAFTAQNAEQMEILLDDAHNIMRQLDVESNPDLASNIFGILIQQDFHSRRVPGTNQTILNRILEGAAE